jgi:hypothetical protein
VNRGQWVVAEQTILGTVKPRYCHVHLAEIDWHHVHNPLDPGHLMPYRDWTTPQAVGLYIDNGGGPRPLVAGHLGARDRLVVAATDRPVLPVLGPMAGLPQVPALVEWRLVHGGIPTAWKVDADFRLTLPPPRAYWQIYAPGTYQNCPCSSIGCTQPRPAATSSVSALRRAAWRSARTGFSPGRRHSSKRLGRLVAAPDRPLTVGHRRVCALDWSA